MNFYRMNFYRSIFCFLLISFVFAKDDNNVYDAERIANIFYELNGDSNDPSKKINHTKGFCALGDFMPSKEAKSLFNVPLLNEKVIPTQVRFSMGGGSNKISDKTKVKGLGLKLRGNTDTWEIVMLNTEINFAKDLKEFGQFFEMRIPKNGKVDVETIKKNTQNVASYRNFEKYLKDNLGISPSVSNVMYHSIHTFFFKDKMNNLVPARWKFVPLAGEKTLSDAEITKRSDNYLEDTFKNEVSNKPIQYKMFLVLANPDDIIDDTTVLWKGKHKEIEVGLLSVNKYDGTDCNFDVFLPSILPQGIEVPQDPLFETRNVVYGITFGRRQ